MAAIASGYFSKKIEEAAFRQQKDLETGDRVVVGVNRFVEDDAAPPPTLAIRSGVETDQIDRLRRFRARRNPVELARRLASLEEAARQDRNLMPELLTTVDAGATIGEIISSLKSIFGSYKG
jgi:methylmalonyl-CoA mutase, N-terminal domain